jgi:outer membrane biosynthesis protein TonB
VEVLQSGTWVTAGDETTLTADTRARIIDGALRLEARLQLAPPRVAPTPKLDLLRNGFVPIASFLMLGLFVFAGVASGIQRDEDAFEPRTTAKLSVYMVPPPPKTKPIELKPDQPSAPQPAEAPKSTRKPPAPAPAAKRPPPHLAGLSGMTKALDQVMNKMNKSLPSVPGKGARQDLLAGIGKVGGPAKGIGIGIGPNDATGIGVGGKKGGEMKAGRTGLGAIGGQVLKPTIRDVFSSAPGSIDKDAVMKVIMAHLSEVTACYERALLSNPSLSGKLSYEWVIGTSGQVTSVKLKSASLKDQNVAACVNGRIKSWVFPRPRGGQVTISFPFMFQSSSF